MTPPNVRPAELPSPGHELDPHATGAPIGQLGSSEARRGAGGAARAFAAAAFRGHAGVGRAVLAPHRSEGSEAAVKGVRLLDFLAVGDRSRRGEGGRGEQQR